MNDEIGLTYKQITKLKNILPPGSEMLGIQKVNPNDLLPEQRVRKYNAKARVNYRYKDDLFTTILSYLDNPTRSPYNQDS